MNIDAESHKARIRSELDALIRQQCELNDQIVVLNAKRQQVINEIVKRQGQIEFLDGCVIDQTIKKLLDMEEHHDSPAS